MNKTLPTLAFITAITATGCDTINWFEKTTVFTNCAEEATEQAGKKEDCDKLSSKADDLCKELRNEIAERSMSLCMTKETNMPTKCRIDGKSFSCEVNK
ncbi:MAG: hypothetical protein RBS56_05055 [Candidatus Gracilibacteria bacterium]|jgi:hypothetical protein|nr:hypothetical protein [Candidatus Gracilibacteria bacterium]